MLLPWSLAQYVMVADPELPEGLELLAVPPLQPAIATEIATAPATTKASVPGKRKVLSSLLKD
jgi:hypothetical protein